MRPLHPKHCQRARIQSKSCRSRRWWRRRRVPTGSWQPPRLRRPAPFGRPPELYATSAAAACGSGSALGPRVANGAARPGGGRPPGMSVNEPRVEDVGQAALAPTRPLSFVSPRGQAGQACRCSRSRPESPPNCDRSQKHANWSNDIGTALCSLGTPGRPASAAPVSLRQVSSPTSHRKVELTQWRTRPPAGAATGAATAPSHHRRRCEQRLCKRGWNAKQQRGPCSRSCCSCS